MFFPTGTQRRLPLITGFSAAIPSRLNRSFDLFFNGFHYFRDGRHGANAHVAARQTFAHRRYDVKFRATLVDPIQQLFQVEMLGRLR